MRQYVNLTVPTGFGALPTSAVPLTTALSRITVDAGTGLESLSAAQKHLLRMGPTNALSIQRWLNQLNQELSKEGTQP